MDQGVPVLDVPMRKIPPSPRYFRPHHSQPPNPAKAAVTSHPRRACHTNLELYCAPSTTSLPGSACQEENPCRALGPAGRVTVQAHISSGSRRSPRNLADPSPPQKREGTTRLLDSVQGELNIAKMQGPPFHTCVGSPTTRTPLIH